MESADWQAHMDFRQAARRAPDSIALSVNGKDYSYRELAAAAESIAEAIGRRQPLGAPVAAIYANRNFETYAAVLGALMSGFTYVPLNPIYPAGRNAVIVSQSGASVLLGCSDEGGVIAEILEEAGSQPDVIFTDQVPVSAGGADLRHPAGDSNPYAYIMFTSGSTGTPKGVPIRHSNLSAYLDAVFQVADYSSSDRLSQNFDLTFDLSVHDMFVCWRAGARLVVPSAKDLETPAAYIKQHAVTCWFSVPTLAQKMSLQGALGEANLPNLRLSLFCGEALPMDLARKWQRATGQRVENWYGPTEATIACMRYVLPDQDSRPGDGRQLVSLGKALPGTEAVVASPELHLLPPGESGELLLLGPQLADGYLNSPDKTAVAFVKLPGRSAVHYRTGDRVVSDTNGDIHFIGRVDNQIKIRGYRVELGEIEAQLRDMSGGYQAIVVPLPVNSPTPVALAAVMEGWSGQAAALLEAIAAKLPDYMVPSRLETIAQFPRNASGKVDRGVTGKLLADLLAGTPVTAALPAADEERQRGEKRRQKLIRIIRNINPALSAEQILTAGNLMDAGLDSVGFVNFTAELETRFGLKMDDRIANELADYPLRKIARLISLNRRELRETGRRERRAGGEHEAARQESGRKIRPARASKDVHVRAQRALNFVDAFPDLLARSDKPLAIFVGSSGFFRGISTTDAEARASELGHEIAAINAGIAALSVEGIAQLCEYIRDTARKAGKTLAFTVKEVDPMHLSVLPPSGDLEIINDYLSGRISRPQRIGETDEAQWDIATRGMPRERKQQDSEVSEPDWMRHRNLEVRNTYLGHVDMKESSLMSWIRGMKALSEVSERSMAVIHPLNFPGLQQERAASGGPKLRAALDHLRRATGVRIVEDQAFALDPGAFIDKNHVNAWAGRKLLTSQIVDAMLAQAGSNQTSATQT